MSRFVVKPLETGSAGAPEPMAGVEPLDDTGLFVGEAQDPKTAISSSGAVAWAAPIIRDERAESFPTGEVTVRFSAAPEPDGLESFIERHALELRRRNEFVPEQVVVAPAAPQGAWLPDLVDELNLDSVVAKAWPNTLSRYRRG